MVVVYEKPVIFLKFLVIGISAASETKASNDILLASFILISAILTASSLRMFVILESMLIKAVCASARKTKSNSTREIIITN